jgi:hypothetical protein
MKYLKKYSQYSLNENEESESKGDKIAFAADVMIRMVVTTHNDPMKLPLTPFKLDQSDDFKPIQDREITLAAVNGGFTSKGAAHLKSHSRNQTTTYQLKEPNYTTMSFTREELGNGISFKITDLPETFKYKNKDLKLNYIKAIGTPNTDLAKSLNIRYGDSSYKFDLSSFQNSQAKPKFFKVKDGDVTCNLESATNVIYLIYSPIVDVRKKEPLSVKFNDAFKYNSIEVDKTSQSYKDSMQTLLTELQKGTKYDMISHGSASKVPTKFENTNAEADEPKSGNEALAHARAKALGKAIREDAEKAGIKLDQVLNSAKVTYEVTGPEYENDSENTKKYAPFQFVEIKLTPVQ